MPSHSDEGFEQLAKTVRVALRIDDQVKLDAIDFLRRLKHAGYMKDYVQLPDASLPGAEAKYSPDDQKIYIRDSACAGPEMTSPTIDLPFSTTALMPYSAINTSASVASGRRR